MKFHLSLVTAVVCAVSCLAEQNVAGPEVSSVPRDPATATPQAPVKRDLSIQERGDIFMARKMYREAIEAYQQAPASALMMNKIGIAYHQLVDLKSAESYYRKAIKLDPRYAEAINNLGTVYYARKSYRRAINEYKKVLRIKPDSASTLANLANAYFERKQFELASETVQKALEIDPNIFESRSATGSVVQDRSIGDRATYHYYLAKSYAKAGRNMEALNYIRKAIEEGFKDRDKFVKEPEFAGLRDDPEFKEIMAAEPKVL